MTRKENRKVRKALDGLNVALQRSQKVAADALATLLEARALADRAQANADAWRELYENKPTTYAFSAKMFYRPDLEPVNDLVH